MDGGLKGKNLPKEEYGYFLELRNLIKFKIYSYSYLDLFGGPVFHVYFFTLLG